ncbi:MAG: recombination protein O N-terminal domain-containing protein [Novosphingobium sp.]
MHLSTPAIVCASRPHGETGVIVRLLTAEIGLIGGYVAGGRGRLLRPVLIPGNLVAAELTARPGIQLPTARLELNQSRGPWLSEPLPAAAISWVMALTAATLPERHPYPELYAALSGLLDAICAAPSARGWVPGLLTYEALLLRELGYGTPIKRPDMADWPALLATFDRLGTALARYPLAERQSDVMAARAMLRERLAKIEGHIEG